MLDELKIALCLTLLLAVASPAAAGERPDRTSGTTYGGPTQTAQDIERSREEIQRQIAKEYHYGTAGGSVASNEKPHRHSRSVR